MAQPVILIQENSFTLKMLLVLNQFRLTLIGGVSNPGGFNPGGGPKTIQIIL